MRCRKVRSFLSTYCSGEAEDRRSAQIESHLDDCKSCRREADVYRSMNSMTKQMTSLKTSDDFTARLMTQVANQKFAETRTKAYLPKRIPIFGRRRLATVSAMAVVLLAVGIGVKYDGLYLNPGGPAYTEVASLDGSGVTDRYLTVQPIDNPLLNENKSVSKLIQQYNRWRQFSRSIRVNAGAEQFNAGGSNSLMASYRQPATPQKIKYIVRPVIKNYLVIP